MTGCTRTDEKVDEEERWREVDYILFIDIHKYRRKEMHGHVYMMIIYDCLRAFH